MRRSLTTADFKKLLIPAASQNGPRAVAVSGGVDSMALVSLIKDVADEAGWPLFTFTVDHNLRAESGTEALQVQSTLRNLGIHNEILTLNNLPSQGIEKHARIARYTILNNACLEHGAEILYLAHHADDQAETLLMRLLNGSRWQGLVGMLPVAQNPLSKSMAGVAQIQLHRPLLSIDKEQLIRTCEERKMTWYEDMSNHDVRLTQRNTIRHILLNSHQLPRAIQKESLLSLADSLLQHRLSLEKDVAAWLKKVLVSVCKVTCSAIIDVKPLRDAANSTESQARLIELLCEMFSPSTKVSRSVVLNLLQQGEIFSQNPPNIQKTASVAGLLISSRQDICQIYRQPFNRAEQQEYNVCIFEAYLKSTAAWHLFDNRYWIRVKGPTGEAVLRNLRKSDMAELRALAQEQKQMDKLRDLLRKAPGQRRFTLPVISSIDGRIIALPSAEICFDARYTTECQLVCSHILRNLHEDKDIQQI